MKKVWICLFVSFLFCAPSFVSAADLLTNPGFETPFGGGYVYNPTGLGWTFLGGSGVSQSYTAWNGVAEEGNQFAFLQCAPSSISQTFSLTSASNVNLSFFMELRPGYNPGQQIAVSLNGTPYGTFNSVIGWTQETVSFGDLSAGSYTLTFAGTRPYSTYGDTSAFLDNVNLTAAPVPVPPSALLLAPGLLGVVGMRKRFKI